MLVQRARTVYWKKWAAKHVKRRSMARTRASSLAKEKGRTGRENCGIRKIFSEGGWTQKRLFDNGWSDISGKLVGGRKAQKSTGSTTVRNGT